MIKLLESLLENKNKKDKSKMQKRIMDGWDWSFS